MQESSETPEAPHPVTGEFLDSVSRVIVRVKETFSSYPSGRDVRYKCRLQDGVETKTNQLSELFTGRDR